MSCVCFSKLFFCWKFWIVKAFYPHIVNVHCLHFIIKAKPFLVEISFTDYFFLFSFNTFLGCWEVEVPDQSHKIGEENSVLNGHEVDVDNLGNCPDFPVGKQRVQELLTGIKTVIWALDFVNVTPTLWYPEPPGDSHPEASREDKVSEWGTPGRRELGQQGLWYSESSILFIHYSGLTLGCCW